jgi:flagellar hook-associated protein 3 FlgL
MRITTGMLQRNILADLNRSTERLSHTQGKLSSGKELTRPSDDPAAVGKALMLRENVSGAQQHQRNVADAQGWSNATEAALAGMTDVVHRAKLLTVQGASDSSSPEARASIAREIDQLIGSLKEQANTSYGGRYLLSGTATKTPPYEAGSDAYQGNGDAVAREIGPGVSLTINTTAEAILGSGRGAGDNRLLHILTDVRDHLVAGDTASLQGTDLERLDGAVDTLLDVRAANGAVGNRLEAAEARLAAVEELATKSLSDVEDADTAKTLIDLSTQTAAYQAALKAGANIVQSSLMDFLR